ncbi:Coiled-coil domain-containing protein 81 [Cichlidogyrus casuarinus]|uniref:Coiled-coil domain-containing protein 81 n=1 Tax=Cichlidogyrus casuarinus TaxID=1844966 RepID=A0ABD2QHC5_9PLAT
MNLSLISLELLMSRDMVETCIRNLISTLQRAISCNKKIELTFTSVGTLYISDAKIKFRFFKSFIALLNDSDKLMIQMKNRPGTSDSIMTDCSIRSNGPSSRVAHSSSSADLQPILEENNNQSENNRLPGIQDQSEECSTNEEKFTHSIHSVESVSKDTQMDDGSQTDNEQKIATKSLANLASVQPKFESFESFSVDSRLSSKATPRSSNHRDKETIIANQNSQFLCHACHDRDHRNQTNATQICKEIEEKRKQDAEKEQTLLKQYRELHYAHTQLKEQENAKAKNQECKEIKEFNTNMAENARTIKQQKDENSYESFILKHRSKTPVKTTKQVELSEWLNEQIALRKQREKARKDAAAESELKERTGLAEELAKDRDRYWKERADAREKYKRALSAQIRYKKKTITDVEGTIGNSLLLGGNEPNIEMLLKKRRLAQEVQKEQMDLVNARTQEELKQKEREKEIELDVIQRTKEG